MEDKIAEDFFRKLNFINDKNRIVRLQKENKQKEEKINLLSKESKKIIDEFGQKNKENIDRLNERIKILEEETASIKQERNNYKDMLESIPSFIRRIFIRKRKEITQ